MMLTILFFLIGFSIFVVLQSFTINGIYSCFKGSKVVDGVSGKVDYQGMVFYMIAPRFFEKYRHKWWSKPIWGCISCMSSFYGALTYWPIVIWLFSFHPLEILIFVFDVFVLVYLNSFFYNRQ